MKIIHTADWHLGQSFYGSDRTDEHAHFLEWLLTTVHIQNPDALLIAGDIFDSSNPPASAERLLWNFLDHLTQENPNIQIIITSGNHDSANRLEAPVSIYRRLGIEVRGKISRDKKGCLDINNLFIPITSRYNSKETAIILAVPFLHSDDYAETEKSSEGMKQFFRNLIHIASKRFMETPLILMAHFFAVGSKISSTLENEYNIIGGQNAVDASDLGDHIIYAALGHIHKAQNVGNKENIWYSGSALPMSFTEKDYKHGVNLIEFAPGQKVQISRITYKPLRSLITIPLKGVANFEEVMQQLVALPKVDKNDDKASYPYLEVKVQELKPEPGMINEIQTEAEKHQVRLCRVERVRPNGEHPDNILGVATTEDLQKLSPATIARDIYKNVYSEDMPDDIARLMAEVKRASQNMETEA